MRRNITAFTLIELLVVIAIISLLVSILLPSLSAAKEIAKSTVCLTNTRALMFAQQLYVDEFKVYATFYKTGSPAIAFLQFSGCIENVYRSQIPASSGETLNFPPYVCPNVPPAVKTAPTNASGWEGTICPYNWNGHLGAWYYGNYSVPAMPIIPPDKVERPASCIGWTDSMNRATVTVGPSRWEYYSYWRPPSPRHGRGIVAPVVEPEGPLGWESLSWYPEGSYANGSYLDGHAEQLSLDAIKDKNTYQP